MLNQYTTPPRIPKPSPISQNQEQFLHVVLHERQIQQQQRYYTPQIFRAPSQQTISTQLNSPISNQPKPQRYSVIQQVNTNDMQNQYHQILQYYKELEINMQQQKQENYLKYNEILQKIDNIQQIMVHNINQLNINQKNEYQLLLQELQQQRLENQKRYEQLFYNIEQQKDKINYVESREQLINQQHHIIEQQKQQIHNQNNIIIKPPQYYNNQVAQQPVIQQSYASKPINLEQKLFPYQDKQNNSQDQLNYSQIHNRSNKQSSPQIYISNKNQSQDNNTFGINSGQITPFIQNSPQQQNPSQTEKELYNSPSNKEFINNQMSNQIIKQTKSPREQISPCICINSPNNTSRDNSIQHQKKQIFEKPIFEQVNNKPIFHQNPPINNFDNQNTQQQNHDQQQLQYYQVQQPFHSDESIIIDESKNSQELLQQLKAEYGINSLTQNSSFQLISKQLQLIYCFQCDQYISFQFSDKHLQECNSQRPQRRQNDNYLDKYITQRGDELLIETFDTKIKKICHEILIIKQMMQLAQLQKFVKQEQIQLREFCQIAIIIVDKLLSNPNSSQLNKYYQHVQQIFNVVYMAPQIFYKQQAKLMQKCLDRIKELYLLYKK